MLGFKKQEILIDDKLKSKIEFICSFSNVKPKIINCSIIKLDKTNLMYAEPNRIIIKGITFLAFNNSNDIYVENLSHKMKLSELEDYIKSI